jgi:hypothetical protein
MLDPEALLQPKCVPDGEKPFPVVVEVGVNVVVSAPALDSLREGFQNCGFAWKRATPRD